MCFTLIPCGLKWGVRLFRNSSWFTPLWIFTIYSWSSLKHIKKKKTSASFFWIYLSSSWWLIHACSLQITAVSPTLVCALVSVHSVRRRWVPFSREMSGVLSWSLTACWKKKSKCERILHFRKYWFTSLAKNKTRKRSVFCVNVQILLLSGFTRNISVNKLDLS